MPVSALEAVPSVGVPEISLYAPEVATVASPVICEGESTRDPTFDGTSALSPALPAPASVFVAISITPAVVVLAGVSVLSMVSNIAEVIGDAAS